MRWKPSVPRIRHAVLLCGGTADSVYLIGFLFNWVIPSPAIKGIYTATNKILR